MEVVASKLALGDSILGSGTSVLRKFWNEGRVLCLAGLFLLSSPRGILKFSGRENSKMEVVASKLALGASNLGSGTSVLRKFWNEGRVLCLAGLFLLSSPRADLKFSGRENSKMEIVASKLALGDSNLGTGTSVLRKFWNEGRMLCLAGLFFLSSPRAVLKFSGRENSKMEVVASKLALGDSILGYGTSVLRKFWNEGRVLCLAGLFLLSSPRADLKFSGRENSKMEVVASKLALGILILVPEQACCESSEMKVGCFA